MTSIKKNKHMTLEDRIEIQECLSHGMTFKATAARIGKDQTTVSKEIKKHITVVTSSVKRFDLDGNPLDSVVCPKLLKAPFVCNSCHLRRGQCGYTRHYYYAKQAQKEYEALLSKAREGIPLGQEEFYRRDRIISEGIKKGQHLYHILQTNDLTTYKSSVYRHLKKGYLSVSVMDFPRIVKYKPRKTKPSEYVPKSVKVGRTYLDFMALINENDLSAWVEMDTVIGRIGGKVILTLHFSFCNFMAGILLDNKTSAETSGKLLSLKKCFAAEGLRFGDFFPLILTDNGGEFSDIFTIENGLDGHKETNLFFCDPMQSSQKPRVEKNHTLFRDIVPKGQSFDSYTQDTVNLIFSHVNSVKRKSLNGKTPYEIFAFAYDENVADILGVAAIPAEAVIQSPKLLASLT
jgi:IS30 family transposase